MTIENSDPFAGREYAGLIFLTRRDRCIYIGLSEPQKKKWRPDHPELWKTREDALRDLQTGAGADVEAEPAEPCSTKSENEARTTCETETTPLGTADPERGQSGGCPPEPAGSVASGERAPATSMREGPTVAQVMALLQTALPKHWEQLLRNRLGATDPTDLTPAEFVSFTQHVFWVVKQHGIKDPTAWLAYREQPDAKAAPAKPGSPVEIADIALQRKSAGSKPVALENSPATTSAAAPPRPVARTAAYGTTKAEVLSRAQVAIEAGDSRRDTAERFACAQEDFRASQREIARAVGRAASSVNR
jgi:hypothetical protein